MGAAYSKNVATMTVDGSPWECKLLSYHTRAGTQPGAAVLRGYNVTAQDITTANVLGKLATISIDGAKIFTGYVLEIGKGLQGGIVDVFCYDLRWSLKRTFIGQNHLDTNSIPVIGSDIIFNKDNNPNQAMDPDGNGIEKFVYQVAAEENKTAFYWTYRDILTWVFHHYVPDHPLPTLPTVTDPVGRLDSTDIGEVRLAWMRTDEAIELILSRCGLQMAVDEDGVLYVFDEDNPRATRTLKFHPVPGAGTYKTVADYSADYPEDVYVRDSILDTVSDVYVVGGHKIKEIVTTDDDWEKKQSQTVIPTGTFHAQAPNFTGADSGKVVIGFTNYDKDKRWAYRFLPSRYSTHGAGKNIPTDIAYDRAKAVLSTLYMARDEDGNYVGKDSAVARHAVGAQETLAALYKLGFTFDLRNLQVLVPVHANPQGTDATPMPSGSTIPVITEQRPHDYEYVSIATSKLPLAVSAVVLRNDLQQVGREAVKVVAPVDGTLTINADGTGSIVFNEPGGFTLPTDWTRSYTPGTPISLTAGQTPPLPLLTVPADADLTSALDKLSDIAARIKEYIGKRNITATAQWPTFVNIEIGTKLDDSGVEYGLTGNEIVVAYSFDAERDITKVVAVNTLQTNALRVAQAHMGNYRFKP
jgi:hypothetical protein